MAGWFSRIIKGGEPAEVEPVEFALTCQCGGIVTGSRGRRMQVAVCRECAYQICVLPISPYPRPKIRATKKKALKPASSVPAVTRPAEEDAIRTPPPLPKRRERSASPVSKQSAGKKASRNLKPPDTPSSGVPWRRPSPKLFTPLRLIAAGMVVMIGIAGWWVSHQRAVARAVSTFAESARAGRTAIAASEYDKADQALQRAVESLQLLGREDREARQIKQLAREAAVANKLATLSLFELLNEARQTRVIAGNNWQRALRQSYQGDWFLLESDALQFSSSEPAGWGFTLPLVPGAEAVQVRGDLSKWSSQLGGGERPKTFVLAGQIADIRSTGQGGGWEIVLGTDSICLWTDPVTYENLGGTLNEGTLATLKAQANLLGVAE